MAQRSTKYSGYTIGQEPSDWSQQGWKNSNIWTVQEDPQASQGPQLLRYQETIDDSYPRLLRWDTPADVDGEVEILALLRADGPTLGVFLRQKQEAEAYYGILDVAGDSLIIGRRSKWGWNYNTPPITSQAFSFTQGTWYYVRFRAEGPNLMLKVWTSADSEPSAWTLQASDTTITGAGGMGLFARNTQDPTQQIIYFFDYVGVGTEADSAPLPVAEPTPVGAALVNAPQILHAKAEIGVAAEQSKTNFENYLAGAEPSDWSQQDWGASDVWTVQEIVQASQGTKLLQYQETVSDDYPRLLRWDTPADVDGEVEILALLQADSPSLGVFLRQQQYLTAYYGLLDVAGGSLIIGVRRGDWDWNHDALNSQAFSFTQDTWYYVRFRASGSGLNLKVWASGDPEPASWTLQATDTSITGAGGMGLFARNTKDTTQITYFYDYVSVGLEGASAPKPAAEPDVQKEVSAALANTPQTLAAKAENPAGEPDLWVSAYLPGYGHVGPNDIQGDARTLPTDEIQWDNFTHLIYFAVKVNDLGEFENKSNSNNGDPRKTIDVPAVEEAVAAAHTQGVPILMSFGGANSHAMTRAIEDVENPGSRDNLVNNIIEDIVKRFGVDGVDIDLEPIDYFDGNLNREVQTSNGPYEDFVKKLHQRLNTLSPTDFSGEAPLDLNNMLLTVAIIGGADEPEMFGRLQNEIDQYNIMTYDASGPWGGWIVWHNNAAENGGLTFWSTTAADGTGGKEVPSAEKRATDFHNDSSDGGIQNSIPYAKIGIGTHFGGYEWWNGEAWNGEVWDQTQQKWVDNPGGGWTGEPVKLRLGWQDLKNPGPEDKVEKPTTNRDPHHEQRYWQIASRYDLNDDFPENHNNYVWDAEAKVSYLSYRNQPLPQGAPGASGSDGLQWGDNGPLQPPMQNYMFVSFEDVHTVRDKIKLCRRKGYGGLIVWELSGGYRMDMPTGEEQKLLQALGDELANPTPA